MPPQKGWNILQYERGRRRIVWGGRELWSMQLFDTGSRYDPDTNTWTTTSIGNAPQARRHHTAIWTGSEMIIWGGECEYQDDDCYLNTGGRYNPASNSWIATSIVDVPEARSYHTAVWTGTEMIVWGGWCCLPWPERTNSGGRYNPVSDSWIPTSATIDVPEARYKHTAIWTGTEMIIWGGMSNIVLQEGESYNPITDDWTLTSTINAPSARMDHTALWTGTEMIIWGGDSQQAGSENTGGRYNPLTDTWILTAPGNGPDGRRFHSAVWTGTEMIIWGGGARQPKYYGMNTGARYNPITDSWSATSLINAPSERKNHTAQWTGEEMIIWGGNHSINDQLNSGARYNPIYDAWSPTSLINAPEPRMIAYSCWTGSEMIVWGGFNYDSGKLNSGGRYNPVSNSWIATSLINAPPPMVDHTLTWTGSEMIVWGIADETKCIFSSGKKYHPSTDSWTPISNVNAPPPGYGQSTVWTGSEMIIWGGYDRCQDVYLDTGGQYNPGSDSWIPTSTVNAPYPRAEHTALWTGYEMLVWGPKGPDEGGKYNPFDDSWTEIPFTTSLMPTEGHSAVWTGSEMIAWGGYGDNYLNTGGRYCCSVPSFISLQPYLLLKPPVYDSAGLSPNGIIEPDEQVMLLGRIQNTGTANAFNVAGALSTYDPITIDNSNASYGAILSGKDVFCSSCYSLQAPSSNRPSNHWDFTVTETVSADNYEPVPFNYIYHVGNSFIDAVHSHYFYQYIETLLHSGITGGCTDSLYCPNAQVKREQLAKFLCLSMNKYNPGICSATGCNEIFSDVKTQNIFCPYIEALYLDGIVTGCAKFSVAVLSGAWHPKTANGKDAVRRIGAI